MSQLNNIGKQFAENLVRAKEITDYRAKQQEQETKVNVVGAGGVITAAFEQLRNAAENTEEHLLLQGAIKRFFKRIFITRDSDLAAKGGEELAVELTLAGYIPNDELTKGQLKQITELTVEYYNTYEKILNEREAVGDKALAWTLDVLSSRVESILNDHSIDNAFVDASSGYLTSLVSERDKSAQDFGARLLVAIYRSLLKSNEAITRQVLLERYGVMPTDHEQYVAFNKLIDKLFESKPVDRLTRLVDRQGAPLRILRRMMYDRQDVAQLLQSREKFLEAYEQQIHAEYERTSSRLNRAIIRSVIFLIVTKFLIGIAMEVPYDLWVYKEIHWVPLLINLFFPPVYMLLLRSTLSLPSYANTTALVDRADAMLYGNSEQIASARVREKRYSSTFNAIYALSALLVFAGATWILVQLGFSWVHIIIFFLFFCAASFLGFRLSRLVRELEVIKERQNGFTFIRDLIYLPFVIVGQWMSEKYSKVNVVAILMDMLIELPLKTILRLVRQWNTFIDDRKDNI